jgi:hypothetical protein
MTVLPLTLAKKAGDAAGSAIKSDLLVYRRSWPAQVKVKKDGTEEVVVPERTAEAHLNGGGLLAMMAALGVGALGVGLGWVLWNGIKVKNPIPVGDRVLTVMPGMKDDPPYWLGDAIARSKAARNAKKYAGLIPHAGFTEHFCRGQIGTGAGAWDAETGVCYLPPPPPPVDAPQKGEFDAEASRFCNMTGGKYDRQPDGKWKCVYRG